MEARLFFVSLTWLLLHYVATLVRNLERGIDKISPAYAYLPTSRLVAVPSYVAELLTRIAAELALFAGAGFLLLGLNDLAV